MAIDQNFYINKKNKEFLYSLWFLSFVLVISIGIFWYNTFLVKANQELEEQIINIDNSLNEVKKDKRIQIKELIDINKSILKELDKKSNVVNYIKHLRLLNSKYGINLEGFDYNAWKITTTAKISSDERGPAYGKLVRFIQDYRLNKDNELDLMFVNTISGHDTIEFTANFKLK
jgi:hypothetical protein